jgi:hypothetical protein
LKEIRNWKNVEFQVGTMGAGCSCGKNPTSSQDDTSGKNDVTSGLKDETEEEVESRPPTPFSRPITAVVLQRKVNSQNFTF